MKNTLSVTRNIGALAFVITFTMSLRPAILVLLAMLTGACGSNELRETRAPAEDTISIDRDKAEWVKVNITLAAGELRVSGGSAKLLEGRFRYDRPSWKPKVRYDTSAFRGRLTIEQSRTEGFDGDAHWELKLSNDVPMDMTVRSGATDSTFQIGALDLRKLEYHVGVGKVELDLRGTPKRSYDVRLNGGVGEAVVRLPSGVNLNAEARGGLGDIDVSGLTKEGGRWVRHVSEIGAPTVQVEVHGAIGSIKISAE